MGGKHNKHTDGNFTSPTKNGSFSWLRLGTKEHDILPSAYSQSVEEISSKTTDKQHSPQKVIESSQTAPSSPLLSHNSSHLVTPIADTPPHHTSRASTPHNISFFHLLDQSPTTPEITTKKSSSSLLTSLSRIFHLRKSGTSQTDLTSTTTSPDTNTKIMPLSPLRNKSHTITGDQHNEQANSEEYYLNSPRNKANTAPGGSSVDNSSPTISKSSIALVPQSYEFQTHRRQSADTMLPDETYTPRKKDIVQKLVISALNDSGRILSQHELEHIVKKILYPNKMPLQYAQKPFSKGASMLTDKDLAEEQLVCALKTALITFSIDELEDIINEELYAYEQPTHTPRITNKYDIFGNHLIGQSLLSINVPPTTDADRLYAQGKDFARIGQYEEAIKKYKEALNYETKPQYYQKIASSYYFLQKIDKAEFYAQLSFELDKNDYKTYLILSSIYRCKYSESKVLHRYDEAENFKTFAIKSLKKCKALIKTPKDQTAYCIEQVLMSLESDNPDYNEHLVATKKAIKRYQYSLDENSQQDKDNALEAEFELSDESTDNSTFPHYQGRRPSQQLSEEERGMLITTLENSKALLLQKQLNEVKSLLETCITIQRECVTRNEVSIAIAANARKELEAKQMLYINENPSLLEYFEGFIRTINQAYIVGTVISSGKCSVNTNSLVHIATQSLSLIPLCGSIISATTSAVTDFVQTRQKKNEATYFIKIATGVTDLVEKLEPAARKITLEHVKQTQICSTSHTPVHKGFFNKVVTKIDQAYQKVMEEIYTSTYDTPAKRLAYEDACKFIEKWVEYQKILEKTKSDHMGNKNIPDFIYDAVIGVSHTTTLHTLDIVEECTSPTSEEKDHPFITSLPLSASIDSRSIDQKVIGDTETKEENGITTTFV